MKQQSIIKELKALQMKAAVTQQNAKEINEKAAALISKLGEAEANPNERLDRKIAERLNRRRINAIQ